MEGMHATMWGREAGGGGGGGECTVRFPELQKSNLKFNTNKNRNQSFATRG